MARRIPPTPGSLRAAAVLAARQAGVLSRQDALRCGLSAAQLTTLVRRGEWTAVAWGGFAPRSPTMTDAARAALDVAAAVRRRLPDLVEAWPTNLVARGDAAAAVLGLPLLHDRSAVHLMDREQLGPLLHLSDADVVRRNRVLVTAPAWTSMDIARADGLLAGVVAADAAMRTHGVTREQLEDVAVRGARLAGNAAACRAAQLARHTAESPLESIGRVQMVLAGLPEPVGQVDIEDAAGLIGRVDHVWADLRVIGEADGRKKYEDEDPERSPADVVWVEKKREDRLRASFEVFRYTWAEAFYAPALLVVKAQAAFALASRRFSMITTGPVWR